jgi:hypothetical protein
MNKTLSSFILIIILHSTAIFLWVLSQSPFERLKSVLILASVFLISGIFCRYLLTILIYHKVWSAKSLWSIGLPPLFFIFGYACMIVKSLLY